MMIAALLFALSGLAHGTELPLAEAQFSKGHDFVEIPFSNCRQNGEKLTGWKINVSEETARIQRIAIFYTTGQAQLLRLNKIYHRGESTEWIPIGNSYACVKSLRVFGNSIGGDANLEVMGFFSH